MYSNINLLIRTKTEFSIRGKSKNNIITNKHIIMMYKLYLEIGLNIEKNNQEFNLNFHTF